MKKALGYSFKIWLGTIVLAPILLSVFLVFVNPRPLSNFFSVDFLQYLAVAAAVGGILSLPFLFVSAIIVKRLAELERPLRKMLTAVFALLLTILPFLFLYLYEGFLNKMDITRMMFCYAFTVILLVFVFPLPEA